MNTARPNRLSVIMLAGFLALFLNLFVMQILKGGYYQALSEKNRIRVIYLEAPRGVIFDRTGRPLVTNRLSYNCSAFSREAKFDIKRSCQIIGSILGIDAADLEKNFRKRKQGVFNTILMAEDITPAQAMAIEEKVDMLPGFVIETRPRREYPWGEAMAHLTGFIGPMMGGETDRLEFYGYKHADWLGRDGVEKTYESYLRGVSGGLQMEVDSRGRFVRALGVKEPKEGNDIQLTVDAKLQSYVQGLLKDQKGAVAVMELKEGGLLSINSAPSYDPNLFASSKGRKEVGRFLHGRYSPMVNRNIRGQYPPGSIYKIVTALAALEQHKITENTTFNCPGFFMLGTKVFHCWTEVGHGSQSLTQAFAHSCDVYFYNTGVLVGIDALFEKSVEFGFSKVTGVDLPGEKEGLSPSREWKKRTLGQPWYDGDSANLAIGQGYLQVTPIQALVMIAATATEGQIYKPHVIDTIRGEKVATRHTKAMTIPSEDWKAVKEGLDQVVNSDTGTGRLARVPGLRVAGKTGTAQSGQDKTHAWFVGFAPIEDPKIAMVVFLEHGGRGGVSAASLASSVFRWLKEANYL